MKNIGVLVAVEIEAVTQKFSDELWHLRSGGFDIYVLAREECTYYFVHSGAGQIKAAAAVQMLYDKYEVELVINFGVVGALTPELSVADTCFVKSVVHYEMDTSEADGCEVGRHLEYPDIYIPTTTSVLCAASEMYPEYPVVIAASGDKFVGSPERKAALHEQFGAEICDMESAAVVMVCDLNGIPNLLIKTISDSVTGGGEEFWARSAEAANICINTVEKVIKAGLI